MDKNLFGGPAEIRPTEDLTVLAAEINDAHEAGEIATRRMMDHFRAAGEALLKAKALCGHGKWLPWLKKHVKFSQQTASNYMRIARDWDKLPTVGNLRDAIRLLSERDENSIVAGGYVFTVLFPGLMPPLATYEWRLMKKDIQRFGILVPVIVDEDLGVIDGVVRLKIAAELGLTDIPFEIRPGLTPEQKLDLCLDVNLNRRHLTPEQIQGELDNLAPEVLEVLADCREDYEAGGFIWPTK